VDRVERTADPRIKNVNHITPGHEIGCRCSTLGELPEQSLLLHEFGPKNRDSADISSVLETVLEFQGRNRPEFTERSKNQFFLAPPKQITIAFLFGAPHRRRSTEISSRIGKLMVARTNGEASSRDASEDKVARVR
jgi:hypothetical protein